jgi:hypothetical protein
MGFELVGLDLGLMGGLATAAGLGVVLACVGIGAGAFFVDWRAMRWPRR